MKKLSRFVYVCVLPLFFLIASTAALATDTDGDGVQDSFMIRISAGEYHTCALDASGLRCWGLNGEGQTTVPPLTNPVAVSAGARHSCAMDDTGVHCWGWNFNGQTTVPVLISPVMVSAGGQHTCALDASGVHCWGAGLTSTGTSSEYGQSIVPSLSNPVAVSAGNTHTCALDDTGVHCWGNNTNGQATVPALTNPVAVSAGWYHTCAIDDMGVHCWGDNVAGETNVPELTNPVAVSAGVWYSCALDDTGVHCWGNNANGQTIVPVMVNPVGLSAGRDTTCAVDDVGAHCWGSNYFGQSDTSALTSADNCISIANTNQLDTDKDDKGDVCDTDDDNDDVNDAVDAFPLDGTESVDTDGDNLGDNSDPIIDDANTLSDFGGEIKTDKVGSSVAYAGDFNGDGYGDHVIGIPGYDISATLTTKIIKDAGRAVVISGKNGDELIFVNGVATNDAMGFAVAGGTDFDGDGFDDVVVGAPYADDTGSQCIDCGSVNVFFGPDGARKQIIYGTQLGSLSGYSLAMTNDDKDGYSSIVIGTPKADDYTKLPLIFIDAGSVTVFSNMYGYMNTFHGDTSKAYAGSAVAVGDFDNNGLTDIIIGAPSDDNPDHHLKNTGSVSVYSVANRYIPIMKKYGAVAKAYLGKSVASGDVNNDNYADVLAGAPGDDTPATPSAKKIADTGSVIVFSGLDGSQLTKKYGATAKAGLGNSVAAGDVNGDGYADIIAGAKLDDKPTLPKITKDTGSVSVWSGDGYAQIGSTLYGDISKDYFGTSVNAGDVNGDGHADLIIGIPGFDIPPALPIKTIKDTGAVKVQSGATLSL